MGLVERIAHECGLPLTIRGGLPLIEEHDAAAFLDGCDPQRVRVLGIEGFHLRGGATVPDMDAISDYSDESDAAASISQARRFVRELEGRGLLFDFTLAKLSDD